VRRVPFKSASRVLRREQLETPMVLLQIISALAAKFPAPEVVRTTRDQAGREAVWVDSDSRGLLSHFVQESLSLVVARSHFVSCSGA